MAGAAGFEPANGGIKSRCLTTWRRPSGRRAYSGRQKEGTCEGKGRIALVDRQIQWREKLKLPRATRGLDRYERALIVLLESGPSAATLIDAA